MEDEGITITNTDVSEPAEELLEENLTDLYILAKIWMEVLKIGLLGTNFRIIPVVEAAKPPPPPCKPPPMRYKDLPIYNSPHHEYKEYLEDKKKCPQAKTKIIHVALLPKVKTFRQSIQENWTDFSTEFASIKKDVKTSLNESKNNFKNYMRDPNNLALRQATLALGGMTGHYIGSGKGILRRIFFTGCGLLAAGALCFPKETDEQFREISYQTAKFFAGLCTMYCGKESPMREKLPCKDELPGPPGYRQPNVCPKEPPKKKRGWFWWLFGRKD